MQLGREQSARTYPWIGVNEGHHGVSHHQDKPEKIAAIAKINAYHIELLSYFVEKMAATPDGDGSLLDHSMVLHGSGMCNGNLHDHKNLPLVLLGGGSGQLRGGRHIKYKELTPMANLLLGMLDKAGVPADSFGDSTGRVDLDTLNPSWLIFSDGFSAGRRISAAGKRVFDIVSSLLILIVGLPLIVIFGLAVKLDSKGPVFFRQRRVGLYGQEFQIVKLRSMRTDAEAGGAKWEEEDDPRITRVGRIIRKLRIDELPQLWSVLKGHMSFVGPRPEVPTFVEELERELPYYAERHEVKPGITGWAQINFPYGASIEDARQKLEYDLYYAKNYTPFLDLLILLQTARVIIWPHGAR
jgi:lipopolysaccharide/colanic/teichoic acid biosynthesis glycosyltransferase